MMGRVKANIYTAQDLASQVATPLHLPFFFILFIYVFRAIEKRMELMCLIDSSKAVYNDSMALAATGDAVTGIAACIVVT